jgi:glycosyltransferase involved in cell wall biosynthesis
VTLRCRPDRGPWPTISIVIPSYNYGQFLERAITSVLNQSYPHTELIVIDGASSDATPAVLARYRPQIAVCISEPDAGQADALNKGFQQVRGELFSWLNADDALRPGALAEVARLWCQGHNLIGGVCNNIHERLGRQELVPTRRYSYRGYFDFVGASFRGFLPQPAVFAATSLAARAFPLDTDLRRAMDYQYFLRLLRQRPRQVNTSAVLVDFHYHGANLTGSDVPLLPELLRVCEREILTWPPSQQPHWQHQLQTSQQLQCWLDAPLPPSSAALLGAARQQPPLLARRLWWRLMLAALARPLRGQP